MGIIGIAIQRKYRSGLLSSGKTEKPQKNCGSTTRTRVDLIIKNGYNLEVVWESQLKEDPHLINKILKKYDNGK
jgi:G:T-mismatch repair DNA endonuclease (very short patch repair protein)